MPEPTRVFHFISKKPIVGVSDDAHKITTAAITMDLVEALDLMDALLKATRSAAASGDCVQVTIPFEGTGQWSEVDEREAAVLAEAAKFDQVARDNPDEFK